MIYHSTTEDDKSLNGVGIGGGGLGERDLGREKRCTYVLRAASGDEWRSVPLRFSCAATSFLRDLPPRLVRLLLSSFLLAGCATGSSIGFPVRVLLMLVLRIAVLTVLSSLSCSSASAMSNDENGPSKVAALGFLTLRCLAAPPNGDVFLGKGVVPIAGVGFIGVAGAS